MERLEWIAERRRFAEIAPAWDRLAAGHPTPFLLAAWLEPWLDAFAPRRPLRLAALWRGQELAAGAMLIAGVRQWRAPVNDHSPAYGLLAADEAARSRLAQELLAHAGGLLLGALSDGDPATEQLRRGAAERGRLVLVEPMHATLHASTGGGLEAYLRGVPSKKRSELARVRRKAQREHELLEKPLAVPEDLESALDRLIELEGSGWKGRAGTAISGSPRTEAFYRAIARRFHAAGALRISELRLDGRAAAIELSIVHGGRLFTPKSGYDERLRSLAPGLVLQMAAIERCFELGLAAYEFTGPAYDYQRPFATGERRLQRLRIHRREPLGAARHAYHRWLRPGLRDAYRAAGRPGRSARPGRR